MRFIDKKGLLLAVAVVMIFLLAGVAARGNYQFPVLEKMVTVILAPFEYAVAKVTQEVRGVGAMGADLFSVYRENQALREEVEQLRQANLKMTEVMAENARLRTLLDYRNRNSQYDLVTAMVIARDPGTWTNTIVIDRGTKHGIAKDMPVITPRGLVGTVTKAFEYTAKVQLILDPRSAVGALVQRPESRVAAIVEGNAANPQAPRMVNIARDADIIKGDKIITSGFGGIYPKGLLIGEVCDVINDEGGLLKYAVLKPSVDFDRLEEVFVIVRSREGHAPSSSAEPPKSSLGAGGEQPSGAGH